MKGWIALNSSKNQQEPQQLTNRQTCGQQSDAQSSEREQAKEVLQESERRFRAVWEVASDAMALSAPDGTVRWTTASGQVLYDEAGKPIRMIGVSIDGKKRRE